MRAAHRKHSLVVLALGSALVTCGTGCDEGSPASLCASVVAAGMPPCNDSLADSPWPASHRSSYAQGSSAFPGLESAEGVVPIHTYLPGVPITLATGADYGERRFAVWAVLLGLDGSVVKLDADSLAIIDSYVPAEREPSPPSYGLGISGAYSLIDDEGHFIVARGRFVEVFADERAGERSSPIQLLRRFDLPDALFCGDEDAVVGMTMTYDGHLAMVTTDGALAVLPKDPSLMDATSVVIAPVGGGCAAGVGSETISNSIAADEDGGIYVVSDAAAYRFDWSGEALRLAWRTTYEAGLGGSALRLGPGSGSTPSLMGTGADEDRFVVLTDGQPLMHLVLMFRGEIPAGWEPIAPGKDPRIACEVPVRFGDEAATESLSEQSVLVAGYSAIVVNDKLTSEDAVVGDGGALTNASAALLGGDEALAPSGIERIDWDPATRKCETIWANPTVQWPNGIPTMSQASRLIYGVALVGGRFGVEALSIDTGESRFFVAGRAQPCGPELDAVLPDSFAPLVQPYVDRLPGTCENSVYAATEVGPGGSILTGTFYGASRYGPR